MSALDDLLKGYPSTSFGGYGDYDDYDVLAKPVVKQSKSKMTTMIQNGSLTADNYFPFVYRGNKYTSLGEMCDDFGLDVDWIISAVKKGMTFSEAISKAEDLEDCSAAIERVQEMRAKKKQEAEDAEIRRREYMLQDDINRELIALNRDLNVSGLVAHVNLLGLCRRDFLKVFASTLHSGKVLDLRYLRDLPRCDLTQFVMSVEKFFNKVTQDLGIQKTKEDLLKAYYHAMWVDGIPHDDGAVDNAVETNKGRDLYELMQEREKLIVDTATTNKVYNYLERNHRSFVSSSPITTKTVDGWYSDLSKMSKIPVDYIKYLTDDCGNSIEKVVTCQKMQYLVKLKAETIKAWGFMKLEYYFDIYVDKLLAEIDLEGINVNAPLDVTDFVANNSALHKTSWRDSTSGKCLNMSLFSYYNKIGYDIVGVDYTANELSKDPNFVLEN